MGGIKYYQLSKDEELPDEFCAVKDIGGEPSEYTFYVPEAENAKLRTALSAVLQCSGITKRDKGCDACPMYDKEKEYVWAGDWCGIRQFIRELGVEVD